jgi:hypothetical protein
LDAANRGTQMYAKHCATCHDHEVSTCLRGPFFSSAPAHTFCVAVMLARKNCRAARTTLKEPREGEVVGIGVDLRALNQLNTLARILARCPLNPDA